MHYSAFGLCFESRGLAIPELPHVGSDPSLRSAHPCPDVVIEEEDPAQWPTLPWKEEQAKALRMLPGELQLDVEDVGFFWISSGNRIAWSRWSADVSDQTIRAYLLGSALGALLIQRSVLVLHGNALTKDGQAIICVGDSGAGKSTLAYTLMTLGWELLADDLVAITPEGVVLPGVQRIKLWGDAVEAFGLDPTQLTPIQPGVAKFQLAGASIRSAGSGIPLKVCYVLPDDEPAVRPDQGGVATLPLGSNREAMAHLLANMFRPQFVNGLGMQGHNFLAIASLLKGIQVFRLTIPNSIVSLGNRLSSVDLLKPTHSSSSPFLTNHG